MGNFDKEAEIKNIGTMAVIGHGGMNRQSLAQFLAAGHLHCSIEVAPQKEVFDFDIEGRINVLEVSIKDAEWRIGSYMVGEDTSREDAYVQKQLSCIKQWQIEWNALNSWFQKDKMENSLNGQQLREYCSTIPLHDPAAGPDLSQESCEIKYRNAINALEGSNRHLNAELEKALSNAKLDGVSKTYFTDPENRRR